MAPTKSYRWWLRLQLGIGLGGGAAWIAGVVLEEDFVTGIGLGLFIAALALRLGRRAARREAGERTEP